jgi:hypothetical protein
MASNVFFSYSRADSNFTLQLATKLAEAGENIWLDQFDIEAGEKWDNEIQKALEMASTLVVILSSSSVKSDNVMDEVSYAIGKGKKVIPVLIEECEIPFRLRRFQYANFIKSYHDGLSMLVDSLELDDSKRTSLLSSANEIKMFVREKKPPVIKDSDPSSSKSSFLNSKRNKILVAVLSILVTAGAFWFIRFNLAKKDVPLSATLKNDLSRDIREHISPIAFNVQGDGVILIYESNKLSRRDTFKISATETIQNLMTALISHYKISPTKELLDAYAAEEGEGRLEEVLWVEHKPVHSSGTLAQAGLKNYDVIEFHYELTSSRTMAIPTTKD